MKLFRGRLGFPRWSFTDGLTKPRRVAERDPNDVDEGEETTQLPRFAMTHTAVGGVRSALTPTDRRLAAEHANAQRSFAEAASGIIQPAPSRPVSTGQPDTAVRARPDDVKDTEITAIRTRRPSRPTVEPNQTPAAARAIAEDPGAEQTSGPTVPVENMPAPVPEPVSAPTPDPVSVVMPAESVSVPDPVSVVVPAESVPVSTPKPAPAGTGQRRPLKAQVNLEALEPGQVNLIEQLREWMADQGDWPGAATEEAVDRASTSHPDRVCPRPAYRGLPSQSPAVVRAKNGRGFGGLLLNRRRRRRARPRPPLELDVNRLDEVLTETRESLGAGLIAATIFEAQTGLPLATDRGTVAATAMWHRASHDLTGSLRHADLPGLGGYYLVKLTGGRIAVVVHAHPDLGACLTFDLDQVPLGEVLQRTIPSVRQAVASAAQGPSR